MLSYDWNESIGVKNIKKLRILGPWNGVMNCLEDLDFQQEKLLLSILISLF